MYDPENALACFPVKRPNMLFYDTRPPLAITGRIFKIRTYNLDELFFIGSAPHASCSFQFLIMDRIIKRRGQTLAPSNPRVGSIPIESYKDNRPIKNRCFERNSGSHIKRNVAQAHQIHEKPKIRIGKIPSLPLPQASRRVWLFPEC